MTVYELWNFLNYLIRKDPIGNSFGPDEFNRLLPIVVFKYFKKLYGLPEHYQKGLPVPEISFGLTQAIEDKLSILKKSAIIAINSVSGLGTKPADYFHTSELSYNKYDTLSDTGIATGASNNTVIDSTKAWVVDAYIGSYVIVVSGTAIGQIRLISDNDATTLTVSENWDTSPVATDVFLIVDVVRQKQVDILNDQEFGDREASYIINPTVNYPCARQLAASFEFAPKTLEFINMLYLKYPTDPVFGYVVNAVGNDIGEVVYADQSAEFQITNAGGVGDQLTISVDASPIGTYTNVTGDTTESIMLGIVADINLDTFTHKMRAVYDGTKVSVIPQVAGTYTFGHAETGTMAGTFDAAFTSKTTESDWVNDTEAMTDIADYMISFVGLSLREPAVIEYAEFQKRE
jgi:hypothetical protein